MRALVLFALGLLFGGVAGFLGAASQGVTLDGHDHADPALHAATADHAGMLELSAADAPGVSIDVMPDLDAGHNLYLTTRNFTFAPQSVGKAHVPGEGHAHVYVNDAKLGRLYGDWYHLSALPLGDVKISVTLNANDHRTYAVDGTPVSAVAVVTVD